ncbi:AMP-binding protein [Rhodococcus sp. IEGM 1408]|uniref:AMP-binding protein n=1 Tax=Rhodococcus sp. IEGM 1408 TaxID=3082220 RepID=UPI002952B73B|nr:AMP-binding protein [Rhodococcus sp. IEGM 1408]MDV8001701.1 AMP-binding protein [Rhodococcus sp. IEGM 1408]
MTISQVQRARVPLGLVPALAARGGAIAVVTDHEEFSYAQLARRVADRAAELPAVATGRRMIGLVAANSAAFVLDYLAALEAGHVVLLLPPESAATRSLVAAWSPDLVLGDGEQVAGSAHAAAPRHGFHDELTLLLSTSGSTGAPKLVRLSRDAVLANARSIADYLHITEADRAITTLPPHYCYGLSVLHSHLLVGASIVLNADSVSNPRFWDRAADHGVTTFAAVPHTVELMERAGLEQLDRLEKLRYLTQAGGRLAPAAVRRLAERLESRGAELVVMYGQTEATARMGYLPPHLARTRPGAVGVAIPGGAFRVDAPEGSAEGELVYTGLNIMMGYAGESADLARGPELSELRTGDLARIADDGLVEIVGRLGREAKIFGHRIDLGRVEAVLADHGIEAWCVGEADRLVVVTRVAGAAEAVAAEAAEAGGLPVSTISVLVVADPPRTPAGKVDHAALRDLVATGPDSRADTRAGARAGSAAPGATDPADLPSGMVARALGVHPDPAACFVDLGGDSLTYVVLSTRLEELVSGLPVDWHLRPLAELDGLARSAAPGWTERVLWRDWARVDTSVLLRALFIVAIVGTHSRAFAILGGAHVLVALVGHSLARFRLHARSPRERSRGVLRTAGRIAVPAVLWLAVVTPFTSRYHWYSPLLATNLVGPRSWWADRWWNPWQMWFIEAAVYALLGVAALMAIPAVTRLDRRFPLLLPAVFVAVGLTVRFRLIDLGGGPQVWYSAPAVLWLFGLGWAIARSRALWSRVICTVVALACVPGWFGDPGREAVILGGLVVLTWVPAVRLPRPFVRVLAPLAAASLFIYLTHFLVYPPIRDAGHPWLALGASLAVGVALWWGWERAVQVGRRWPGRLIRAQRSILGVVTRRRSDRDGGRTTPVL